jgi:plasmid stability protein
MKVNTVNLPEEVSAALEQLAAQTGRSLEVVLTQAVISYLQTHLGTNELPQTQTALSLSQRQSFLKLPVAERRRLLEVQAEALSAHYQTDTQWQELQVGDLLEY